MLSVFLKHVSKYACPMQSCSGFKSDIAFVCHGVFAFKLTAL